MPEYDVGPDDGFDLRQVGITGCQVLIARIEGRLHGTAALCPHAGAPLVEGVLHDGVITCPWHKAAFDLRSGACTAPPAVDDLPAFPVRVEDGRVLVNLPATLPAWAAGSVDGRCFVMVGAGAAGQQAAQTLRAEGFGGRIVLISPERELPYDRTVLSKYALSGQQGGEKSPLQSTYFYQRHGIERRLGRVTAVDPAGGC